MSNRYQRSSANRLEEIFKDPGELQYVLSLPEVERERLLFEREQLIEEQLEKSKLIEKVKALERGHAAVTPSEERRPEPSAPGKSEEPTLPDKETIDKITLSRKDISAHIFRPEFERVAKGAFVRLSLDPKTYRLCEIVRLVDCVPYTLEGSLVNKKALLRQGKSEREFKFDVVSNQPCSTEELNYYYSLEPPNRSRLRALVSKAKECTSFFGEPLTEDEINMIIVEKRKLRTAQPSSSMTKQDRTIPSTHHQPTYLKLSAVSLDPSDPFSRKKAGFSPASNQQNADSSVANKPAFSFRVDDPKLLYDIFNVDLDMEFVEQLMQN